MYLALDPSFRRTGIAILTDDNTIIIKSIGTSLEGDTSFQNIYRNIKILIGKIGDIVGDIEIDIIISEIPPPKSMFSAGLWALDTALFLALCLKYRPKNFIIVPASFISRVVNIKKHTKKDSVNTALQIIQELDGKFKFDLPKRSNHDAFEAFIILTRLLAIEGKISCNDVSCKTFFSVKEKIIELEVE